MGLFRKDTKLEKKNKAQRILMKSGWIEKYYYILKVIRSCESSNNIQTTIKARRWGLDILRKEYELSVWDETLGEKGQKKEIKRAIIGAHDMDYLGRATSLKLSRKINGTNTLTFQLPSKYFDSKLGEYVHNEFCDYLFNERKLKS